MQTNQSRPSAQKRQLFDRIVNRAFLLALAFVLTGIALVIEGTHRAELEIFGMRVSTLEAGAVSIILGAVWLIWTIADQMQGPNNRRP
jgi:hypothetical protein